MFFQWRHVKALIVLFSLESGSRIHPKEDSTPISKHLLWFIVWLDASVGSGASGPRILLRISTSWKAYPKLTKLNTGFRVSFSQ